MLGKHHIDRRILLLNVKSMPSMYDISMNKEEYFNTRRKVCQQFELVENYDKALAANFNKWILHHRLGEQVDTKILKELGLYYDRPPQELKWVTLSEHIGIHNKQLSRRQHRDSWRQALSRALKGKRRSAEVRKNISLGALKRWKSKEEREKQSERAKAACTPDVVARIRKAKVGRIWWTNGKDEKCQRESPGPDWTRGRMKK